MLATVGSDLLTIDDINQTIITLLTCTVQLSILRFDSFNNCLVDCPRTVWEDISKYSTALRPLSQLNDADKTGKLPDPLSKTSERSMSCQSVTVVDLKPRVLQLCSRSLFHIVYLTSSSI